MDTAPDRRREALARAAALFDDGTLKARLGALVEIPSTAQEPGFEAHLTRYLEQGIQPWLEGMGFTCAIHPNPQEGFGPIMIATRIEDAARPTILLYGHGSAMTSMLHPADGAQFIPSMGQNQGISPC